MGADGGEEQNHLYLPVRPPRRLLPAVVALVFALLAIGTGAYMGAQLAGWVQAPGLKTWAALLGGGMVLELVQAFRWVLWPARHMPPIVLTETFLELPINSYTPTTRRLDLASIRLIESIKRGGESGIEIVCGPHNYIVMTSMLSGEADLVRRLARWS